jgi:hypothetical protein
VRSGAAIGGAAMMLQQQQGLTIYCCILDRYCTGLCSVLWLATLQDFSGSVISSTAVQLQVCIV